MKTVLLLYFANDVHVTHCILPTNCAIACLLSAQNKFLLFAASYVKRFSMDKNLYNTEHTWTMRMSGMTELQVGG
jgi:hypothetical protein